jgi:hypothetical protein
MTTLVATRPSLRVPVAQVLSDDRPSVATLVDVLVCGGPDRGDDAAAAIAMADMPGELAEDVAIRYVGRLDIDDLLAIPDGAGAVVVDTAVGVDPGWVVEIPFIGFAGRESGVHARSSDALSRPETVGVASMIRGRALIGMIVAIGGTSFCPGEGLTWPVAASLPDFRLAIADAVDRVRGQVVASTIATS